MDVGEKVILFNLNPKPFILALVSFFLSTSKNGILDIFADLIESEKAEDHS